MKTWETELHVLGQGMVAIILGGILGWEREKAGKWAGFRTHMLVCLAAMLFVRVGQFLVLDSQEQFKLEAMRADPLVLIEAVVTGIAFIGAGTVFRAGGSKPHGLTTAATLLAVGPIGIAVALERYLLAVGITVIVFVILRLLALVEPKPELKHED